VKWKITCWYFGSVFQSRTSFDRWVMTLSRVTRSSVLRHNTTTSSTFASNSGSGEDTDSMRFQLALTQDLVDGVSLHSRRPGEVTDAPMGLP
jgi:hypothetical protein